MTLRWAGLAALSLASSIAVSQSLNYAQRGTQVRAGVVLIDSSQVVPGVPANRSPHVWYNLDSNTAIKPAGWNIYNPNAPAQATQEMVDRWAALGGGPTLFERLNKRMAGYWEVQLSKLSDAQISQYDVLLLDATGNVALNALEREKLRQFVDRGGILWVETASVNQGLFADNVINNFPIPFGLSTGTGGGNFDQYHPALSYPYTFGVSSLPYLNGSTNAVLTAPAIAGSALSLSYPVAADWGRLKPVVLSGGNATMMVGRIGDGFEVVTSRDAAGYLNRVKNDPGSLPTYLANQGFYALDPRGRFDKVSDTLGRLAVNIISLGSGSEQSATGSRKSGSIPVDISAPLLMRYDAGITALDPGNKTNFPVASYKNIIAVSANDRIYVYDANPKQDLDGDNNLDDGLPDFAFGTNEDLLWVSQPLSGPISAPICVEVANPVGLPSDQVMVTDANGQLVSFAIFPTNAFGQIVGNANAAPLYAVAAPDAQPVGGLSTGAPWHGPYAPTYHEGLVYVATNHGTGLGGPNGMVWIVNPANGQGLDTAGSRWFVGGTSSTVMNEITASPTVGYIPIADNSGGMDRVVYVPTRSPNQNAGIFSLWAGTRGESPLSVTASGGTLTVSTRASQKGLNVRLSSDSLGVKLTVIKANGDPLTVTEMNTLFNGTVTQGIAGVLDFGLSGAWDPNYSVRVDYTIDWGREPRPSIVRGSIFLPDDTSNRRPIIGSIAMSARGTIYVVHSSGEDSFTPNPTQGGAFYAFREEGQGAFKCVIRYDAYGPHTINLNQSTPASVPATISDDDELVNLFAPILGGTVNKITFTSSPVVKGDYVYVVASMRKTGAPFSQFIPFTVLMAFKSEPEMPEIAVGDLRDGFSLVQPDITRSSSKSIPTVLSVASPGIYQYIRSSGKIRFDSLMTPSRGQIQSAFSLSQPVVLRSGGRPDTLVYPDASAGSRWNPLAWYVVLHGYEQPTTPVVTGGTLFIGGASKLPNIIVKGQNPITAPTTGLLYGINADISERDQFIRVDASRPWLRQVNIIKPSGTGIAGNPNIRWPQTVGVGSLEDWKIRLAQTNMPRTSRTMSLAAGDGGLYVTGGTNNPGAYGGNGVLYGFSRADFVVCDEGRLGRFDAAGNPLFATDATSSSGPETNVGGTVNVRTLQRPVRAYPFGPTDLVAVDPSGNRVVRIDSAGREVRSLNDFKIDPASNVQLEPNESYKFNNPRDVAVYGEFVSNPTGVTSPQTLEYWIHYVVADTGNHRILDVIDRHAVGPNRQIGDAIQIGNERMLGVLRWHSPIEYSGKRFEYTSITRAALPSGAYYYVAGIGNGAPTRTDIGLDTPAGTNERQARDGNGGIIIFDPAGPSASTAIYDIVVPQVDAGGYFDPNTGDFTSAVRPLHRKKLTNLTSVTARNIPGVSLPAIMFTDSTGVYEVINNGTDWVVRWMMPNEVYRYMRYQPGAPPTIFGSNARGLRATYARRLESGDVLIVNGYIGRKLNGDVFNGEVVQVDGAFGTGTDDGFAWNRPNLGFYSGSIRFELPPITGARDLYQPVFADRR